jgi:fission process protein 1
MAMGNLAKPLDESPAGGQQESELTPWPTNTISLAEDYRMVMAKRAVFQSLASMGLPAFTIHSVVKYSGKMVRGSKVAFVRTWVPIGVCFSFLPPPYSLVFFFSSSSFSWGLLWLTPSR